MRMFVNPYTGVLMDLDAVPAGVGGAKFCPQSGKPLNLEAVDAYSYPGPAADRETWARDARETVDRINREAASTVAPAAAPVEP